jgi:hypothetical protein
VSERVAPRSFFLNSRGRRHEFVIQPQHVLVLSCRRSVRLIVSLRLRGLPGLMHPFPESEVAQSSYAPTPVEPSIALSRCTVPSFGVVNPLSPDYGSLSRGNKSHPDTRILFAALCADRCNEKNRAKRRHEDVLCRRKPNLFFAAIARLIGQRYVLLPVVLHGANSSATVSLERPWSRLRHRQAGQRPYRGQIVLRSLVDFGVRAVNQQ